MSSIRLCLVLILSFLMYFLVRLYFLRLSLFRVEKVIQTLGLIFNFSSLGIYLVGWLVWLSNQGANNTAFWGLVIDRGIPRLQGTVQDPNLFVFFNLLFFFYFYVRWRNWSNLLGLLLASSNIVLSLSRGGLLAVVICLAVDMLALKDSNGKIKRFAMGILLGFGVLLTIEISGLNIYDLLFQRAGAIESDGASGRLEIWTNAWNIFIENPWGIGIYNFRHWNAKLFADDHYLHNTALEVLVEAGIIGFTLWLFAGLSLFIHSVKIAQAEPKHRFLLLTFIAIFVSMFSLSVLTNESLWVFIALVIRYRYWYKGEEEVNEGFCINHNPQSH